MKVALYARVSTDEQRERQSIVTQTDFAERYCTLHDLEIVDFYKDDGVSGGVSCARRPEGARMLSDARAGKFAVLLVYRVDRLSRALKDVLTAVDDLREAGVTFRSMTESFDTSTPMGMAMLQMLGTFAELEKANIRERSVEGSRRRAREGQWLGGKAPIGYRIEDGKLVVNPEQAGIVGRIFGHVAHDGMSLHEVAALFNAEGVPLPHELRGGGVKGARWHRTTLSKIVHNPTYVGRFQYGRSRRTYKGGEPAGREKRARADWIGADAPTLIAPEVFEQANRMISGRVFRPHNASREFLLRGLIKCGLCGRSFSGYSPSGRPQWYYRCTGYLAALGGGHGRPAGRSCVGRYPGLRTQPG
jgi:site-specific DNA recombinase